MRARALEIAWHESTSVWALDTAESGGVARLVTAGGDKMARVWRLRNRTATCALGTKPASGDNSGLPAGPGGQPPETDIDAEWVCDLRAHTSTVNVARFAPSGAVLATAADGGEIVVWALEAGGCSASPSPAFGGGGDERWGHAHTLRGHTHDVLDMAWAPCGTVLASASVDNAVLVWRVGASPKPRAPVALRHAANFVQGVAFSPDGELLASLGNDRLLRVFKRRRADATRWDLVATVGSVGVQRLFVDDFNSKNVFRRLAWSPDGNLLACPSGVDVLADIKKSFAVHIFARTSLLAPLFQCGGLPRPAVSVRFCPVLFTLRKRKRKDDSPCEPVPMEVELSGPTVSNQGVENAMVAVAANNQIVQPSQPHLANGPPYSHPPGAAMAAAPLSGDQEHSSESDAAKQIQNPLSTLPYRMVFAVACTDAIFVYDTQVLGRPIARISGLHLAEHTDLCWTSDGRSLFISSTDGYVSCVSFSAGEIGTPLPKSAYPVLETMPVPPVPSAQKTQMDQSAAQPVCVVPRRVSGSQPQAAGQQMKGPGGDTAALVSRNGLSSRVSASLAVGTEGENPNAATNMASEKVMLPAVLRKRQFLQADLIASQRRAMQASVATPVPSCTVQATEKKAGNMATCSVEPTTGAAMVSAVAMAVRPGQRSQIENGNKNIDGEAQVGRGKS